MAERVERDSMGEVPVAADRYWGAQTERARGHFTFGTDRMPVAIIRALAMIKRAAARVNRALGLLDARRCGAIERAATEVVDGRLDDQFPLPVWQSGSGTQTNMNVNEVVSNRAIELLGGSLGSKDPVHPNDHVNLGQSTNDCFPTAMHLAGALALDRVLLPALRAFLAELERAAARFRGVIKVGRTHLQDATPLTLGQEFSGYAEQFRGCCRRVEAALQELMPLAQGGTAVGTGLNAPPRFGELVAAELARDTGLPFVTARNKFEALAAHEPMVFAHGALETVGTALTKVANDVRWLASGPRCGLGELRIPENEPGSSIMPGKVNPTQAEAAFQVCLRVAGNHVTLAAAAASGSFELNCAKPVIAHVFLESASLLAAALDGFRVHCLAGVEPDRERMAALVQSSLMLVTALSPWIGYDEAARVARLAHQQKLTLREAVVLVRPRLVAARGGGELDEATLDRVMDPATMVGDEG